MRGVAACKGVVQAHRLPQGVFPIQGEKILGYGLMPAPEPVFNPGDILGAPKMATAVLVEEIVEEIHRTIELHHIPVVPGEIGDIALPEASGRRCDSPQGLEHLLPQAEIAADVADHKGHQVIRTIRHLAPDVFQIAVDGVDLAAFGGPDALEILQGKGFEKAEDTVHLDRQEVVFIIVRRIQHGLPDSSGQFQEIGLLITGDQFLRIVRILDAGHHHPGRIIVCREEFGPGFTPLLQIHQDIHPVRHPVQPGHEQVLGGRRLQRLHIVEEDVDILVGIKDFLHE